MTNMANMANMNSNQGTNTNTNTNTNITQGQDQNNVRVQQTLSDLDKLQQSESRIYDLLQQTQNPTQRVIYIQEINGLSQLRINLFRGLGDLFSNSASQVQQLRAMESILNEKKDAINQLSQDNATQIRTLQIDDYYGKMYASHANVLKTIVLFCIPLVLLKVIQPMLPDALYSLFFIVDITIACFVVGKQVIDISNRDSTDYDKYNWYFNLAKAPPVTPSATSGSSSLTGASTTCVGQACCSPGLTFDSTMNQCITNPPSTSSS